MTATSTRFTSRGKGLSFAAITLSSLVLLAIFMPNYYKDLQHAKAPFSDQSKASAEPRRKPDSYGEKMLLQTFSEDGYIQYQVQAESMQQYLSDKSTNLQTPIITFNTQGNSPWVIKANDGLIEKSDGNLGEGEKVLILKGAVSVTQNLGRNDFMRLRSEALTLYPDAHTAATERIVTVETLAFRTQAKGVIIDLSSGRMEFPPNPLQRVKSNFIPPPDISKNPALSAPLATDSEYSGLKKLPGNADA